MTTGSFEEFLTIPVGFSEAGEPVGLTLVGDYLTDPSLISAAYAFKQNYPLEKPEIVPPWRDYVNQ